MDRTSLIGVIVGIVAVGVGMVLKGVSPISLLNPAALLIIFAGTAATILIAFPLNEIKKYLHFLRFYFKNKNLLI